MHSLYSRGRLSLCSKPARYKTGASSFDKKCKPINGILLKWKGKFVQKTQIDQGIS